MDYFRYSNHQLHCEEVPIRVLAEKFGTPLWVYSKRTVLHHFERIREAFAAVEPLICYSVKANGNLGVLRVLAEAGSGFDVVSGGELYRMLQAGGDPRKTVFAGVGKTDDEIRFGLEQGVLMFNVESEAELEAVGRVAGHLAVVAPIALRLNPDIDPVTHRHTTTGKKGTKFGIDTERAAQLARQAADDPHLKLCGVHLHLGSPILQTAPYAEAVEKGLAFVAEVERASHAITWLNLGGGFGIHYRKQEALPAAAFAEAIVPPLLAFNRRRQHSALRLALEPGRFIVGNAGILVSRVIYTKESGGKQFVIQDAAMNDLVRPALYDAFHRIWPVEPAVPPPEDYEGDMPGTVRCDVVGPICESGDFLAKNRPLPPVQAGDLLAIFSAGAYGMAMSSNYNSRPRAAEVLVDGSTFRLVRRRETYEDLVGPERDL
ncbi:MAG: diaminopimelate decarboxylase [Planctomycetes bacterium]|nr:diaminopimelate decarboxylase [Planctomycetota bacterium]